MSKVRISVEEVIQIQKRRAQINKYSLEDITWTKKEKPILFSDSKVKDWNLTGLSNIDFIMQDKETTK